MTISVLVTVETAFCEFATEGRAMAAVDNLERCLVTTIVVNGCAGGNQHH